MNSQLKEKRKYFAPLIECILLDNEISLSMESYPPIRPNELTGLTPEYLNNDPFKSMLG